MRSTDELRDVALVPERDVLERRRRVAAHHAREARERSRSATGCACAASPTSPSGPSRTPPRPRAPRCARGGGTRPRPARSPRRPAPARSRRRRGGRAARPASRPTRSRCRGARRPPAPRPGSRCAKVPTAPEILPTAASSMRARQPRRARGAAPRGTRAASGRRWWAPRGCRGCGRRTACCWCSSARRAQRGERGVAVGEQQVAGGADLQRERGVDHVARGHARSG